MIEQLSKNSDGKTTRANTENGSIIGIGIEGDRDQLQYLGSDFLTSFPLRKGITPL